MLRLLPNVLYKKLQVKLSARQIFLGELIVLVFCLHLFIFFSLSVISGLSFPSQNFSVSLHEQGLTYVLMPFQKNAVPISAHARSARSNIYKKSKIIDYQTYQKYKKSGKSHSIKRKHGRVSDRKKARKLEKLVKPRGMAKNKHEASLSSKTVALESQLHHKKNKETVAALAQKESIVAAVPVANVQQEVVKTPEVVHEESVQEIVEQKIDPVIQDVKSEEEQIELPVEQVQNDETTMADDLEIEDIDLENIVFVGRDQLDNSIISSKLKIAIEQCWSSPGGIQDGTTCKVRVKVDNQGKAEYVKLVQPSGVRVFDAQARQALFEMLYPQEVWNKTISISFGV